MVGYVMARHLAGGEKEILRLATWHWERVLQPAHGCHPDRLDMIRVLAVCFASVQYILQTEREREREREQEIRHEEDEVWRRGEYCTEVKHTRSCPLITSDRQRVIQRESFRETEPDRQRQAAREADRQIDSGQLARYE